MIPNYPYRTKPKLYQKNVFLTNYPCQNIPYHRRGMGTVSDIHLLKLATNEKTVYFIIHRLYSDRNFCL
jgi:hypothetical protein